MSPAAFSPGGAEPVNDRLGDQGVPAELLMLMGREGCVRDPRLVATRSRGRGSGMSLGPTCPWQLQLHVGICLPDTH